MKKILIIFTGGTICSSNENGKNRSDAKATESYLIDDFENGDSELRGSVCFEKKQLSVDILSENMTVDTWNELLSIFRDEDIWTRYNGIIVLHGTDTLAYTSSLLSLLLSGAPIPIFIVSAQLPLRYQTTVTENGIKRSLSIKDERSNGYKNFRVSVELIVNGIAPNVYVAYENSSSETLLHLGSHLLQCPNHSNDFHSKDETVINTTRHCGIGFETNTFYASKICSLDPNVLLLFPYPNLAYDRINVDGASAIVHGTYHSESVCVGRKGIEKDKKYSVISFIERCKEARLPLFLAPCNKSSYAYSSTKSALDAGARVIADTTIETAYAKTVIGVSLGLRDEELEKFLETSINHEFVYKK